MEFKKGRYRFVIVFPSIGVAIKLPIIRLGETLKELTRAIKRLDFGGIKVSTRISIDQGGIVGYKHYLFGGFFFNWREFLFFLKTRHPFLQPTYFSFFGLFNVQKADKPCPVNRNEFRAQLRKITNNRAGWDSHHFTNPDNFCLHSSRLRMCDYGSKGTQEIITEHGQKIYESFDPNFNPNKKGAI